MMVVKVVDLVRGVREGDRKVSCKRLSWLTPWIEFKELLGSSVLM